MLSRNAAVILAAWGVLLVFACDCTSAQETGISDPSTAHLEAEHDGHGASLGRELPLWTVLPFAALLLCIAVLPLWTPHWWEHNHNKAIIAGGLGALIALYLLVQ